MNTTGPSRTSYTVVVPTIGRDSLDTLLRSIDASPGAGLVEIVVVDDRPGSDTLALPTLTAPVRTLRSGGRGPAAARNTGWRAARTEWIVFLDDDVVVPDDWSARLADDLTRIDSDPGIAASQARIEVPLPTHRAPTDDEAQTASLERARWITADMAYRRSALTAVGGFDERFPRAYREDSDLALRVQHAGFALHVGNRVTVHPAARKGFLASVRAQYGNADNALMRRKHGPHWRDEADAGQGRLLLHAATSASAVVAAAAAVTGRTRIAGAAGTAWALLTLDFARRRILPGPRTRDEIMRMLVTSSLIPPLAVVSRLSGEYRWRTGPSTPRAVLFDRDDTLVVDVPYNNDPAQVRPVPGAEQVLRGLRARGIYVGVVTNQSGVAQGRISLDELASVNRRVDELLGPFHTWQVCCHDRGDGCECRKPEPGMVTAAAQELGVQPWECVLIGDTGADVDAALAAGARAILVPTARTLPDEVARAGTDACAAVAEDLEHAVSLAFQVPNIRPGPPGTERPRQRGEP
jgi:HAD superfamily hydrolase (TIGR01662 family)